jgi:hypothetical protein
MTVRILRRDSCRLACQTGKERAVCDLIRTKKEKEREERRRSKGKKTATKGK